MSEYYMTDSDEIVTIGYDSCCESPRKSMDNLGTFLIFSSKYSSPDKDDNIKTWDDLFARFEVEQTGFTRKDMEMLKKKSLEHGFLLSPVYILDHGIVKFSLTDPCDRWDNGIICVIYSSIENAKKWFMLDDMSVELIDKVRESFKGELDLFTTWANDGALYYVTYDMKGNETDSCTGFYGSDPEESGITEYVTLGDYIGSFSSIFEALGFMLHKGMLTANKAGQVSISTCNKK